MSGIDSSNVCFDVSLTNGALAVFLDIVDEINRRHAVN